MEDFLYTAPSFIPGGGQGLYTARRIHKGECFAEYKGKKYNPTVDRLPEDTTYMFGISDTVEIDGKSIARYANDAMGAVRILGLENNCDWYIDQEKERVFLMAVKDIAPHSEIFVGYGDDYWERAIPECRDRLLQMRSTARTRYYNNLKYLKKIAKFTRSTKSNVKQPQNKKRKLVN